MFRTGLCKSAIIDELVLRCHRYSVSSDEGLSSPQRGRYSRADLAGFTHDSIIRFLETTITEVKQDITDCSLFLDYSNLVNLEIKGLNYDLFTDRHLVLHVECQRASFESKGLKLVMRGCVKITTGRGECLLSNAVTWDMKQNRFTVPGRYVLGRDGQWTKGKGFNGDEQLSRIVTKRQQRNRFDSSESGFVAWRSKGDAFQPSPDLL